MNNRVGGHYVSAPLAEELSVKVLRSVPELEEIRGVWESWPGHRDSDMGLFLEVLSSNPEAVRPHVIVVYRDGRPDAILVGRIDSTTFSFRIGYWRFAGPRVRLLTFVVGAQRGNSWPAASEMLVREALSSLRRGEAEVARLPDVPIDSALCRLAMSLPRFLARDHGAIPRPHWLMELPKTYDEILQQFSGHFRKQLKGNARKLEAGVGNLELRCFEKAEEVEAMLCDIERVAAESYQRRIGAGFHDTPSRRKLLLFQGGRGSLLCYVLYAGGKPGAFWLGSLYAGVFHSDYLGFDPILSRYSPGALLEVRVLEDLCARHARSIDLGTGDYLYKQRIGTTRYEEADIYMYALTVRGLALNAARSLSVFTNETLKGALDRLGVLSSLKAAWGRKRQVASIDNMRQPSASPE